MATRAKIARSTSWRWRRPPQHALDRLSDPKPTPQALQRPGRSHRTSIERAQTRLALDSGEGVRLVEVASDRADQALQRRAVEGVLATEVDQHLRSGDTFEPLVVGEVAGHRSVLVAALGAAQVHAYMEAGSSDDSKLLVCGRVSMLSGPVERLTPLFRLKWGLMCLATVELGSTSAPQHPRAGRACWLLADEARGRKACPAESVVSSCFTPKG